jgi:hypothetical protein
MAQPPDALAFIDEIRVAEFWRKQLGELEYSQRDPSDLFRWYKALELRGPDEIRAYLNERMGRTIGGPVTGIVSEAPHPPRAIIDIWLATHDKARPAPYVFALLAFILACMVAMPNLNGCQTLQAPNPPSAWLPQSATLTAGQLDGAPQPISTLPAANVGVTPPPSPVAVASPNAATIAAQNGANMLRSTPLGAEMGPSTQLQTAASSSVSSSSLPQAASPIATSEPGPAPQGTPANAPSGTGNRRGH